MREQLIQYVNLLFAGAADCEDIRQEILQNTLDRFDDLVDQGKSPEAAYRLAISGIGDINEILGNVPKSKPSYIDPIQEIVPESENDIKRKKLRANGIVLYILSAIPLIVLSELGHEILGLVLTLIMVAGATYNMIVTARNTDSDEEQADVGETAPKQQLKKSIEHVIWAIGLAVYFILSFSTGAWYITWILFPLIGCVEGLVNAIIDLKEAK